MANNFNAGALALTGGVVFEAANIVVLLVDNTFVFDNDMEFVDDLVASELATTGYARVTLTGKTRTIDLASNRIVFDGNNPVWAALGPGTGGPIVRGAIVFIDTGSDATSTLLFYEQVPLTVVNGGSFTVNFSADGISYLQQ